MTRQSKTPLCGLILAGGKSVRMGRDKAAMIHPDGRPLARRAWDLLLDAGCDSVVLSLREEQEIPAGFEEVAGLKVARDATGENQGPLGGIVSGMRLDPEADWLVLACDLPRLDSPTLRYLISSQFEGEKFLAYRSENDGLPEPLCAIYGCGSLGLLEVALAAKESSPRQFLRHHHCRLLDPLMPGALENANTPGDWETAVSGMDPLPTWHAELHEIWISSGNDFKGRHGIGRLHHGITSVREIECVANTGLRGDRYFGFKQDFKGQVTFLDLETVHAIRNQLDQPDLSSGAFRRNLIVSGVKLGDWIGQRFLFQGIEFEGAEECKPCYWMDESIAPGVEEALKTDCRGGLRARILTSGVLRVSS